MQFPKNEPVTDRPLVVLLPAAMEQSPRTDVADALRGREFVSGILRAHGYVPAPLDITPEILQSPERIQHIVRSTKTRCVFNIFEGFGCDSGSEHQFRSLVEEMSIPCTGNPSGVLQACLSKETCSRTLRKAGIPVPEGVSLHPGFDPELLASLRLPVFVKPLMEDGSVGIDASSFVQEKSALLRTVLEKLSLFPRGVRAEEFIPGREYSVACIGNGPYNVLGVSVIDYEQTEGTNFLDYDSKWDPASPLYSLVPQRAEGAFREKAAQLAAAAGRAFGCRGYFRVDMRERHGILYVLDVNPNPDITPDGGFLRQCREAGFSDEQTVHTILELAFEEDEGGTTRE